MLKLSQATNKSNNICNNNNSILKFGPLLVINKTKRGLNSFTQKSSLSVHKKANCNVENKVVFLAPIIAPKLQCVSTTLRKE
jgi:hypothetical protein